MQLSEQIDKIAPAFVKAQAACNGAKKAKNNPAFKSKYADLSEVWAACEDALEANGLGVIQALGEVIDGKMHIDTMLVHASGQWIKAHGSIPLPKVDPQGYGSASTYARRYSLAALMGIVQEDDDGNAASCRAPSNVTTIESRPPPRTKLEGPWTSVTALEAAAKRLVADLHGCGDQDMLTALLSAPDTQELKKRLLQYRPGLMNGEGETPDYEPINALVRRLRAELPHSTPNYLTAG